MKVKDEEPSKRTSPVTQHLFHLFHHGTENLLNPELEVLCYCYTYIHQVMRCQPEVEFSASNTSTYSICIVLYSLDIAVHIYKQDGAHLCAILCFLGG